MKLNLRLELKTNEHKTFCTAWLYWWLAVYLSVFVAFLYWLLDNFIPWQNVHTPELPCETEEHFSITFKKSAYYENNIL